jgi:dTMP kinase
MAIRNQTRGLLVDVEGIDGSGKGTQSRALTDRLQNAGFKAELISFPRYEATFFGQAVGDYLNGRFGSLDQVHPFLVSLLFAGDRFESRPMLLEALSQHDVVVLDRYVASNVAHQAAKAEGAEREALCRSIDRLEHGLYGLPRPDLVILLDLSVAESRRLIARKSQRAYTDRGADIQEADAEYLSRVRDFYLELARGDANWSVVRCDDERGVVRSIDQIGDEIWRIVSARLTR